MSIMDKQMISKNMDKVYSILLIAPNLLDIF
jgi:hypothetical protein